MSKHYLIPNLISIVGYEQISFLKSIKIDQWDLIICIMDYYAKGQNTAYEAYWQSYRMVLDVELNQPENHNMAKQLLLNLATNRATTDMIYVYVRDTLCTLLHQQMVPSQQFLNIGSVSQGDNYFRIEIMDGPV